MVAMTVVAISLLGCGEDQRANERRTSPRTTRTTQPAEPSYRVIELTETGTIAGNVRWIGDPFQEPPAITVAVNSEACGETQPSRALIVSERGGIVDVVISIDIRAGAALEAPTDPPVIDNVGCRFEPHVLAAGAGHTIHFRNSDEILHNVHAFAGDDTVLDLGLPEHGSENRASIDAPGVYRVVCDAGHGWQQAWVHLFEHPYFAVTDENGYFRIEDVPTGQYRVRAWHEGWRIVGRRAGRPRYSNPVVLTRSVSVSVELETTVDFELSVQSSEIAGD